MNEPDRRMRRLAADIREMLNDARQLRGYSARARRLSADMLGYLRGARDYERVFGISDWADIEATLSRARLLRERLLHEVAKVQERAGRRAGAALARDRRSAILEDVRRLVMESARQRKARNPALSKADLARQCAREFNGYHCSLTAETVRGWLKGIDL